MSDEDLGSAERERLRRRDRRMTEKDRALMQPGMAKVFKQIVDRQAKDADEIAERDAGPADGGNAPGTSKPKG